MELRQREWRAEQAVARPRVLQPGGHRRQGCHRSGHVCILQQRGRIRGVSREGSRDFDESLRKPTMPSGDAGDDSDARGWVVPTMHCRATCAAQSAVPAATTAAVTPAPPPSNAFQEAAVKVKESRQKQREREERERREEERMRMWREAKRASRNTKSKNRS